MNPTIERIIIMPIRYSVKESIFIVNQVLLVNSNVLSAQT